MEFSSAERSLSFDMYYRIEELLNDDSISFNDKKEKILESFALMAAHSDRIEQVNVKQQMEIERLQHNFYTLQYDMFPMRNMRKKKGS